MISRLELWARAERQIIVEELKWLRAGGKLVSPSGEDVTQTRLARLVNSLEGVSAAIKEIEESKNQ